MSENCKSLVLQDKCNIEIFLSPVFASISAVTVYLEGVYQPAITNLCQNDLLDDIEAHGLVEILRQFVRVKAIGELNSFLAISDWSSADSLCKQFGPRSRPSCCRS